MVLSPKREYLLFLETIYFIPEEVYVPPVSIERYKNLFSPFYPSFDEDLFYKYLEHLDVKDNGKLTSLSFGQQKKFIIAFALACNTKVLLLDEPTNGLDIPSKIKFRKLFASIFTDDKIIFISTHQIRDLDNLIDRVIIVDDGKLLLNASVGRIAEKLCFKTVSELSETGDILYSEESLKGFSVVMKNYNDEDTKVNLEHLFTAITYNPAKAKAIFKTQSNNNE